jgi:hypothetical protein
MEYRSFARLARILAEGFMRRYEMKYLNNTPTILRDMHENNKEGQARKLLGVLLSDSNMTTVWNRLGRRINKDNEWIKLWQAIKIAIYNSNPKRKEKLVKDEEDDFKLIAKRANELAKLIKISHRSDGYSWHLDLVCHQFCPDDVMEINGVQNWNNLDSIAQHEFAASIMTSWPTMAELLEGLEAKAMKESADVESKRIVLKNKGRSNEIKFMRNLYKYFSQYTWEKRDCIFSSIAVITNIAITTKYLKTEKQETVSVHFVNKQSPL